MSYWLSSNKEQAEINTLNQLIGKLSAMKEHGQQPTCEEILEFIEKTVNEETEHLNKSYPDKA